MNNEEYIRLHREEDVRQLALRRAPEGVDAVWCLQQIEGWQLARKKLPRWAATDGVWFPPRLSMEQCSSEATAQYKRHIVERLLPNEEERQTYIDLTGGFGIDFSYMARGFEHAIYVERMSHLCDIAIHNSQFLIHNQEATGKLTILNAEVENLVSEDALLPHLSSGDGRASIIFLDPARRDGAGRKVAALEDCSPNVVELKDWLLDHARYVVLKLSPMLDITEAMRKLKIENGKLKFKGEAQDEPSIVKEVHVVSVQGECKEVLIVLSREGDAPLTYHCVNLETDDEDFVCDASARDSRPIIAGDVKGGFLFEPNASILKAGVQDALCERYGMMKLNRISNLYLVHSAEFIVHSYSVAQQTSQSKLPGRLFVIDDVSDFSKAGVKALLSGVKQANLTIRNFPGTVAELRKRLKIKEGGDVYLFATTLADGSHCLIKCHRSAQRDACQSLPVRL